MNQRVAKDIRRTALAFAEGPVGSAAFFADYEYRVKWLKNWKKGYSNLEKKIKPHPAPRRSMSEKARAAIARGQAEKAERASLLAKLPFHDGAWVPIQNLRREVMQAEVFSALFGETLRRKTRHQEAP